MGQTISTYLVENGVENLTLCDFDVAEISNLNRQILLTANVKKTLLFIVFLRTLDKYTFRRPIVLYLICYAKDHGTNL
ncbi:MAG: hypothetical protein E7178_04495 [Erysipelotrichaceae bacterium]|nr:hypothetical protein [Erysipelotrichaceae bacterium]